MEINWQYIKKRRGRAFFKCFSHPFSVLLALLNPSICLWVPWLSLATWSSFAGSMYWIKCHITLFSLTYGIPPVSFPPISPPGLTLPKWRSPWGGTRPTSRSQLASRPACPRQARLAAYTATCLESSVWAPTRRPWRTVWCQDGEETRRGCAKPP